MGKDLNKKELGTGLSQRKDGRYNARATVNGNSINLYGTNLAKLKIEFNKEKERLKKLSKEDKANITLNEWFEKWFVTYKVKTLSQSSINPIRSRFKRTFGKKLGNTEISKITNIMVQEAINALLEDIASSTIKDAFSVFHQSIISAKNHGFITEDPCFEIIIPLSEKPVKRRFLSEDEEEEFLKAAKESWYYEMFVVMFNTGLRVGEVGGLKWSDIDFSKRKINISRQLMCQYELGEKKIKLTPTKTVNSNRSIPFFNDVDEKLISFKRKQSSRKKEIGSRWRESENSDMSNFVFTTTMGSPVIRHIVQKEIKKIVKDINLQRLEKMGDMYSPFEDLYPHAIRHSFCSRCFERGLEGKVVQQLMGHANYATTIDIYTHISENLYASEILKFNKRNDAVKEVAK